MPCTWAKRRSARRSFSTPFCAHTTATSGDDGAAIASKAASESCDFVHTITTSPAPSPRVDTSSVTGTCTCTGPDGVRSRRPRVPQRVVVRRPGRRARRRGRARPAGRRWSRRSPRPRRSRTAWAETTGGGAVGVGDHDTRSSGTGTSRRARRCPASERGPADEVMGPYPSKEEAEHWRETVEARNEAWEQADREWEARRRRTARASWPVPEGDTIHRAAARLRPGAGRAGGAPLRGAAAARATARRPGMRIDGRRGGRQAPARPLRGRAHAADPHAHDRVVAPLPAGRALAEGGPPQPGR